MISGIFLLMLVMVVYGVFKRPMQVDMKHLQPQLDGTWRDWLR